MIRILHPQIIGLLTFLIVWTVLYIVTTHHKGTCGDSIFKIAKKIYGLGIGLALSIFLYFVLTMASVNEVPRNVIDRQARDKQIEVNEELYKADAEKAKALHDSSNNVNNH